MKKNVKQIFLVVNLLILLIGISTISATDIDDDITSMTMADTPTIADDVTSTNTDNYPIETYTANIKKEEKNLKTSTKIVEVNNFDEMITTIRNAENNPDNDEYIINLNNGTYLTGDTFLSGTGGNATNILINANNQSFTGSNTNTLLRIFMNCNITIDNATINIGLDNFGANITIKNSMINSTINNANKGQDIIITNSTINTTISNGGTLIIDDDTILGSKFNYMNNDGTVIINDTNKIYPYTTNFKSNSTLHDLIISKNIHNIADLTLKNCTLNSAIYNDGKVIIDDDCIIGEKLIISGNGTITINDTSRILPYMNTYNGDYYLENIILSPDKTNYGNLSINNSTINSTLNNYGNIHINNTKINSDNNISNYNGTMTINNSTINQTITTNTRELTINNSNISKKITSSGNMTITNSTLDSLITNNGILTIDDNSTIGKNFNITGSGRVLTNNTELIESLKDNGIYVHEDTIRDTIINSNIKNNARLTIKNSTLNSSITNYDILVIDDDCIIGENLRITNNGKVIIDDITKILPYIDIVSSNYTISNITFNRTYTFNGNISLINCNITAQIINDGNLTLINTSLSNNNMTTSHYSKTDGFLLLNNGNSSLINCIMENNTFNSTSNQNTIYLYGGIVNKGFMNIINSSFDNNNIGYVKIIGQWLQASTWGYGAAITNNGTLFIDNSTFKNCFAANAGGAINNGANLTVNNSHFINNTANTLGSAIYNNIRRNNNAKNKFDIYNSEFMDNYVNLNHNSDGGGGAIADHPHNNIPTLTNSIINCTFKNNRGEYTGNVSITGVSAKGGALLLDDLYNITNSTFINNNITFGSSEFKGRNCNTTNCILENSSIICKCLENIINNTFKNNSGIVVNIDLVTNKSNLIITDNSFTDNNVSGYYNVNTLVPNTIHFSYNDVNEPKEEMLNRLNITIKDNIYTNTSIHDEITLNIPDEIIIGESITITGTYTLLEPENYDTNILEQNHFNIYINGNLNQTVDTLEFSVTPTDGSMLVTVQPTISQTRKTASISTTTSSDIIITPENYSEYVYEGTLIGVTPNSKITFKGVFTDKEEIYIDTNNLILDGSDATFTNTEFVLDAEHILLKNMNIENSNTTYPIGNFKDNNIIINNTIIINNPNMQATAIYSTASNTLIANNTLYVEALAGGVDWDSGQGVADTQAILLLGGENNTVENNDINIKSTQATGYNTLEAITNSNGAKNTLIRQNRINISGANFNYAIDSLNSVENITIKENTITVDGERYCDAIQIGNRAKNIIITANNMTCTCINTTPITEEGALTYGIIVTSMGSYESENITITENNINLTGTANYAIELYKIHNTQIHNNNITVNGPYSLGIGYSYAPNGNATGNTITINGDSTTYINHITEEIKPENTGIRVQNGTQNIYLENNTITTSDIGRKDTTIHTDESNVTIKNNKLISTQGYGVETVQTFKPGVTFENNAIETIIRTENINTHINMPTTLTVTVTTINQYKINGGTVTFTDTNGNQIAQATVIDGSATATATFDQTGETTITATYNPTTSGLLTNTTQLLITIDEEVIPPELIINPITAGIGDTITITARITSGTKTITDINAGKVSFKVNGKTLKDANGKVIYAKVVNGVATIENYVVPSDWSKEDTTIQAVYTGSKKCEKLTSEKTPITITPTEPSIMTSDITATAGENITLTATITDGSKIINNGKIIFKINGKSIKDVNGKVIYAKVSNNQVNITYTLPADMKSKDYNLTAVFISSDYDRLEDIKTLTVTS